MSAPICEKSFAVDSKYCNFYAGGDVAWSADGSLLYCLNTTEVTVVDVATGQLARTYGLHAGDPAAPDTADADAVDEEDTIYTFALAADHLVTAHRSGLLRLWSLETGKVVKLWKAQHKGPIVKLAFSACGKLICTSGADSTLRVWDYQNSRCLGAFKDYPGPALLLQFHPNAEQPEIYAAGADHVLYCWNYETKTLVHTLRGHLSQVTGISFSDDTFDGKYLASVSRDKVLIVWQLDNGGAQYKVIPVYEELAGCCFTTDVSSADKAMDVIVASVQGNLKLVSCTNSKITTLVESTDFEIKMLLHSGRAQQLAVITAEQNILIYKIVRPTLALECVKQLIGFNDEILDLCFVGADERFLAVATNSKNIKVYDTEAQMNCKIVAGHTDTVITLSSTGAVDNYLLSAGKDLSICLWQLDAEAFTLRCVAKGASSHTSTIGSVSFAFHMATMFASVSQDGSLKVWRVKRDTSEAQHSFQLKFSALAHDKEVNCVAFSPNNKMLATASQDKTAKLWSCDTGSCVGTLRGHIRGVWCVRFSPVDQVVLTTSSDSSMRIWSLAPAIACLKRFEQECSILRAEFIDHGKFIVSAASDGLLKVWNIKTSACAQTIDEHSERIWSLAVSQRSNKYFYSGGADSRLIKWQDITERSRNEEIDKRQSLMLEEQALQTLLQQRHNMQKAFVLALKLGKPKVTYNIVSQYVRTRDTKSIKSAIDTLNVDQRVTLLEHVKAWSTNSRHCKVANTILRYILDDVIVDPKQRSYNLNNMVEVLTPYVQRHFRRVNELQKDLAFLDFIVKCM